jgi:hypothetical protein
LLEGRQDYVMKNDVAAQAREEAAFSYRKYAALTRK